MKYNRWTVLEDEIRISSVIYCYCKCDCGTERYVKRANLINGTSKSCGCLQGEMLSKRRKKVNEYRIEGQVVIGKTTNTGKEFYLDLEDFDKIKDLSWYESSVGYAHHKESGKKIVQLHRFIMNAPEGKVVDHINHNRLDNRKSNLRICTQAENTKNRKEEPKGITAIKRRNNIYYVVQLKGKYLGCYKDYEKAVKMRNAWITED